MNKLILCFLAMMCYLTSIAQENNELTPAPEGLTAEQVIEKYIEARGGREKLSNITDIYTEMQVNAGSKSVVIIIAEKAPAEKAIIQKVNEEVVAKQIFSADRLVLNEEVFTSGARFESAKHAGLMHPELDYAKHGFKLKLLGQRILDGRAVYEVEVTKPSGDTEVHSYDVENGLLVQSVDPIGGTQQFSSYLPVDGVLFPYIVTLVTPTFTLFRVTRVKVNQGVSDDLFE